VSTELGGGSGGAKFSEEGGKLALTTGIEKTVIGSVTKKKVWTKMWLRRKVRAKGSKGAVKGGKARNKGLQKSRKLSRMGQKKGGDERKSGGEETGRQRNEQRTELRKRGLGKPIGHAPSRMTHLLFQKGLVNTG